MRSRWRRECGQREDREDRLTEEKPQTVFNLEVPIIDKVDVFNVYKIIL